MIFNLDIVQLIFVTNINALKVCLYWRRVEILQLKRVALKYNSLFSLKRKNIYLPSWKTGIESLSNKNCEVLRTEKSTGTVLIGRASSVRLHEHCFSPVSDEGFLDWKCPPTAITVLRRKFLFIIRHSVAYLNKGLYNIILYQYLLNY